MDEDEWTDRNFGNSFQMEDDQKKAKGKRATTKVDGDTSEDSISDLETDSDLENDQDDPGSRPLTADETRQLQKEWIKKYHPERSREIEEGQER